ncbi:MAG: LLM class flavin-dependent oxidoreductase, partial [Acidimicrobiia bacterium]|nr:LLM class flavin-dependent oxidoreductase [Acidimicrobiia bacterium]
RDYDEYGYEFGTAPGRLRQLDAAMPRIKARWEKLNPPAPRKMPILIGGGGEKVTLRITAEHADIWHGFGSPETIAHKNSVLDEWCAKVGRDPAAIERSAGLQDPTRIDKADEFVAAGARHFTLPFEGPDYDLGPMADWLAWRDDKTT